MDQRTNPALERDAPVTSTQDWRIQQLEQQVEQLKRQVADLKSLRDNIAGMSTIAKWGFRALILLAGYGGLNVIHRIIEWLNRPLPRTGW
jgi:hypothetical protein